MKTLITIAGICAALTVSAQAAPDGAGGPKGGKGTKGGKGGRPDPAQIFQRLDADDSGGISLEEYKNGPMAKKAPDQAKVEERFNKIAGEDEIISQEEFTAALKKMAEMRGGKGGPGPGPGGKGGKKGGKKGGEEGAPTS
jgi:hypothetical protein